MKRKAWSAITNVQANLSIGNRQMMVFSMCQNHIKYNHGWMPAPHCFPPLTKYPPKSDHHPNPYRGWGDWAEEDWLRMWYFQRCTVKSVNQRCRSNKTFAIISLYFEIYNIPPKNGWAMKMATLTKTATLFLYCVPVNPVIHLTHVGIHVWLLAHFISTTILGGERTIMKCEIIVQFEV